MAMTIFSPLPRKHYEPPKLVIRSIEGRTYYWNHNTRRWTRMTKRCPYLT